MHVISDYQPASTFGGSCKAQASVVFHHPQPFRVWQARQLVRRDVAACVFMFFVAFIYLYKTLPDVCSAGLSCQTWEQHQAPYCIDDRTRSSLWRTVCGGFLVQKPPLSVPAGSAGVADKAQHPTNWLTGIAAVVSRPKALLSAVAQAVTTFFNIGRLSHDLVHLVFPPVCIIPLLLLLLPLPYPNPAAIWRATATAARSRSSSSMRSHPYQMISWYEPRYYWQQPLLRTTVVLLQRLLVYLAAASCVGRFKCQYLRYVQGLKYWSVIGKFAYQGWVAYILVLPMPVQLLVSCCEWLIGYWTSLRINALTPSSSSSSSDSVMLVLQRYQLPISILLSIVLPCLAVLGVERAQRKQYKQVQQQMQQQMQHMQMRRTGVKDSKAEGPCSSSSSGDTFQQQRQAPSKHKQQELTSCSSASEIEECFDQALETSKACGSSSSSRKKGSRQMRDLDRVDDTSYDVSMSGSALQLAPTGSLGPMQGHATAAAAAPNSPLVHHRSSRRSSGSSSRRGSNSSRIPSIGPQFLADINSSLQLAAHHTAVPYVTAADRSAAAAAAPPRGQAGSSSLSGLGPKVALLLSDEAADVFAAAAAESRGGTLVRYESLAHCLPVSVKVHTNHSQVSALGPLLGATVARQLSPYDTEAAPLQITTAAFPGCVQLLANVIGLRAQLPSSSSSSVQLARELLLAVQGGLVEVESGNSSSSGSERKPDQLGVDVSVGSSSSSGAGGDVSNDLDLPTVSLQSCSPVVLMSDHDGQEIRISLKLSEQQQQQQQQQQPDCPRLDSNSSLPGRLLAFDGSGVMADVDVDLADGVIRVSLPVLEPGVVQIALLPGKWPAAEHDESMITTGARSSSSSSRDAGSPPNSKPASVSPLVLLPLLVLPAAAAAELRQYAEDLAAAAAASDGNGHSPTAAVWERVAAFRVDVAYVLLACKQAATAAAGQPQQQMPAGVRDVLKSVLVHAAACCMWNLMQFVVTTAAAVFIPCDRAAESDDSCSSSRSKTEGPTHAVCISSDHTKHAATKIKPSSSSSSSSKKVDLPAARGSDPSVLASSSIVTAHASVTELLWGFSDPSLEARYQAAAFTNSGLLDLISLLFATGLGLRCYSDKGIGLWSVRLVVSQVVAVLATFAAPLCVVLLRMIVQRRLRHISRQQQQQQSVDQGCEVVAKAAPTDSSGNSSSSSSSKQQEQGSDQIPRGSLITLGTSNPTIAHANISSSSSTTAADPGPDLPSHAPGNSYLAAEQLYKAARIKRILLAINMALMPAWAVVLMIPGLLVTPAWVLKVMGTRGLAQEVGTVFGFALKGYIDQVPFSWFWKLSTLHTIVNAAASMTHGLRPPYWIILRNVPSLLLALFVAGRQQVLGRRNFCRQQGIAVA